MRSTVTGHRKLTTANWDHHWNWFLYNYKWSCWRTHRPFYSCLAFETNWKGEKAQWVGASWTDCKLKNGHFELSSSLLGNNNEQFLHWIVMCNEKWILCNNQWWPAQWLDWEEAPKHFTKPNLHQKKKKRSWSLFGGLSLVLSTTVF